MYLPLVYCKKLYDEVNAWGEIKVCFSTDMIFYYLHSPLLVDKEYKGKFSVLSELIDNEDIIKDAPGSWIHSGMSKKERLNEWKEGFSMMRTCYKWTSNKIIYQIDKEFQKELLKTSGECKVSYSMLEKIPYKCFYLEFQDGNIFPEFHGFFVNIVPYYDGYIIDIQRMTHNEVLYSAMLCIGDRGIGFGTETYTDEKGEKGFIFNGDIINPYHNGEEYYRQADEINKNLVSHMKFVLQFIIYLCADNKDVVLSKESEQTYREPKIIKNKYSELRKYEVGYNYGKALRTYKEKMNTNVRHNNLNNSHTSGYIMKPHIRTAHWHTYWVGKGRTEKRLNWLSDIFVHQEYAYE